MARPRQRRPDPQATEPLSGLDYRAQGNAASQNGDYEDAIDCFTSAQSVDWREDDRQENLAAVLLGRATAFYHLEQNDLALIDLVCLYAIKPSTPRAHEREALIRQRRNQFDKALLSYNTILHSNPWRAQKERIERNCEEMTRLSKELPFHQPSAGEYIAATIRCQTEGIEMGVAAQLTLLADEKVELGLDKFYEEIKRGDTYEAYEGLREALDGFFLDSRVIRFHTRKHPSTEILPELEQCLAPYEDDMDSMPDEIHDPDKSDATLARYRQRFLNIAQIEEWDGRTGARFEIERLINSWCILCFIDQVSGGVESINQAMTHWGCLTLVVQDAREVFKEVPLLLTGDSVKTERVKRIRQCYLECSLLRLHATNDHQVELIAAAEESQNLYPAKQPPSHSSDDERFRFADETRPTYRLKMHQARVLELKAYTKERCQGQVGRVTWPSSFLLSLAATHADEASELVEIDDIARTEARYYSVRFVAGNLKPGAFFREFAKIESDAKLCRPFFGKLSRTGFSHYVRLRNYTDYLRNVFSTSWVTRFKLPRGRPILDHTVLTDFLRSRMNSIGRVGKDPLNTGNPSFLTPAVERFSSTLAGEFSLWDVPSELVETKH